MKHQKYLQLLTSLTAVSVALVLCSGCRKLTPAEMAAEGITASSSTSPVVDPELANQPIVDGSPVAPWKEVRKCSDSDTVYKLSNGVLATWVEKVGQPNGGHWDLLDDGITADAYCSTSKDTSKDAAG